MQMLGSVRQCVTFQVANDLYELKSFSKVAIARVEAYKTNNSNTINAASERDVLEKRSPLHLFFLISFVHLLPLTLRIF